MKRITFNIYLSGMSEEFFSEKIMIYKPSGSITKTFSLEGCLNKEIYRISDLIRVIKNTTNNLQSMLGDFGMENFCCENVYLQQADYLLGFDKDKLLTELFEDFPTDNLKLAYIFVAGGASIHCDGYTFVVHPREANHQYSPHVHVVRNNISVRYSLETFERFEQDRYSREHVRDEKKIILPALRENKERLMEYWSLAMQGYIPPAEDENGKQYYKES